MSDILFVKRLLTRASVTVLAGLLLSSASFAEDTASASDDGEVSVDVSIDPPALGVEPEVSVCGFEFEHTISIEPTEGTDESNGTDESADTGETIEVDPAVVDVTDVEILDDSVDVDMTAESMQNMAGGGFDQTPSFEHRDDSVAMTGRDHDVPARRAVAVN